LRIDLILESREPPETIAELGRLAEDCGIGGVWVSSMLDARDPFLNFAELARTTEKVRMGPIALSPYELHPLRMAMSLLTLNEASKGRAQIVVGGGGGTMTAMGLKPQRRVRAVRECLEILQQACSGEPINYEGDLFTVRNYRPSWVESLPPVIYAGANRVQMQRMAARFADGVMLSDKIVAQVIEARERIDPVLDEAGRSRNNFRLNNFWAWHIKPTRDNPRRGPGGGAHLACAKRCLAAGESSLLHERSRYGHCRRKATRIFRCPATSFTRHTRGAGAHHRNPGGEPDFLCRHR
jgi:5,10-methylenetetrahydromethanopterin reductase